VGYVARIGDTRSAYGILVGKPRKRKPLERLRRGSEDNIKMHLSEIGCGDVVWFHQSQDGTSGRLL
jgi:hypothetical protein